MTKTPSDDTIIVNKKAYHEYFVEKTFEAGIALQGWEVKSLRHHRAQLVDSYITIKNHEVIWLGGLITPLLQASTHIDIDDRRTRKLLLNQREIKQLIGSIDRQGYTLVPLKLYWKNNRIKLALGLAKGKKAYDKRATEKDRDWQREKQRLLKTKR